MSWGKSWGWIFVLCVLWGSEEGWGRSCPEVILYPNVGMASFSVADPVSLVRSTSFAATLGQITSSYDSKLRTRIYFGASLPDKDGHMPIVDPNAKAVLIYFHGSGTAKASGKNFLSKMTPLINAGIAPVAVDLPFHAEGPVDSQFMNLDYFMDWVHKLVEKCKAAGKPVYMVGHSFGPFIIQEYSSRYPNDIAGALLISAAGSYHPALDWTYRNITAPGMRYIDAELADSTVNPLGGAWSDAMEKSTSWVNRKSPTLPMHFLRGTNDEWFPENNWLPKRLGINQPWGPRVAEDWLREKYPQATFEFIDGVGHYIFESKAKSGRNLILERMFDMVGASEADRTREAGERTAVERVATLYYNSVAFRGWAGDRYRHMIASEKRAEDTLRGWTTARWKLWLEIQNEIPERYPGFYAQRWRMWEYMQNEVKKTLEKKGELETIALMSRFQSELASFAEHMSVVKVALDLGTDPLIPKVVTDRLWDTPPEMTKWGITGALLVSHLVSLVEEKGSLVAIEDTEQTNLKAVRYHLPGNAAEIRTYAFDYATRAELDVFLVEAYHSLCRSVAWHSPAEAFEWEYQGVILKGNHHNGVILKIEPRTSSEKKTSRAA